MARVNLSKFAGINNRRMPSDMTFTDEQRRERAYVRDAQNVDLTASSTFIRRPGYQRVVATDGCRSLVEYAGAAYFAAGTNLMRFDGTAASVVTSLASGVNDLSYTELPNGLAFSDGYTNRVITSGGVEPLSVPLPSPTPTAFVEAGGALEAGTYTVAFAARRAGVLSAMSPPTNVAVEEDGRLVITAGAQTDEVLVFVTPVDGSTLYLEATIPAGAGSVAVPLVRSADYAVTYDAEAPMPAGTIIRRHRGRLLVAEGSTIYFSMPFNFGLCRPAENYVPWPDTVTLVEPTQGGVYVATKDATWFVAGDDFADPESVVEIAPYGATPGTSVHALNDNLVYWFTPRGAVEASQTGKLKMLQDDDMAFGTAGAGASFIREQLGQRSVISALRNSLPAGTAVSSSFMDAEVITGI